MKAPVSHHHDRWRRQWQQEQQQQKIIPLSSAVLLLWARSKDTQVSTGAQPRPLGMRCWLLNNDSND
jgi:hypothetical protein